MTHPVRGSAREVFAVSLRLGLTSFGGPIAHLGYQRDAFVSRHRWVDDDTFAELVALCQTLPGPASSQLSIAMGRLRAGWTGALAAWVGFTLPSAVLMTLLGLWAAGAGVPSTGPVAGAIAGLQAAAVAVVAHAVLGMGRRLAPDAPRLVIAAVAALAALAIPSPATQLASIAAGAVIGWVLWRGARGGAPDDEAAAPPRSAATPRPASLGAAAARPAATAAAFVAVVAGSQLASAATGDPTLDLVAALVRAGALVFGGGHVVLPLLDAGIVAPGWVASEPFVAGYGAAQAMPGPLFTFASYLGAIASAGPGGISGAVLATIAIFLPGALLVLAALPLIGALRARAGVAGALRGVNAVVVGILAAALIDPVGRSGITSPLAAVVAGAGGLALVSGRVPPLAVVVGSALALGAAAALGTTTG